MKWKSTSLSLAVHAISFLRPFTVARRRVAAVEGSFHLVVLLCRSCVPSRVVIRPKPYLSQPSAPLFTGFPLLVAAVVSSPSSFSSHWLKIVLRMNCPQTQGVRVRFQGDGKGADRECKPDGEGREASQDLNVAVWVLWLIILLL
ncbi:feather keratin 2-like [Sesbania bispinosa]|nr:feather keratin 2-like [Sesbania bispinosa]